MQADRPATPGRGPKLVPGMGVEVARRFDGRFTRGFTVTAVEAERVWVRRHSDGAVLGAFALSEV